MAERRMFSKSIIDSDAFLDMPTSTQNLYFHLSMRADDEGFVNNPKKIVRMVNSSQDDLTLLITKKFILAFETGVIVIKHWKIHNYIRKDRLQETNYTDEKSKLMLNENDSYSMKNDHVSHLAVTCPSSGSIGKDRIGKVSIGKDSIDILSSKHDDASDDTPKEKRTSEVYADIIGYLNDQIGASYKSTTTATRKKIDARLNEGYTLDDFKTVISKKVAEWQDTDMAKYLRPETLFGTKFESYLNQVSKVKTMNKLQSLYERYAEEEK